MAKRAVGVYFSSRHVDIVELGGTVHAPRILNFIREKISATTEQLSESGQEKTQGSPYDYLSLSIKEVLGRISTKPTGVYTVLPSRDVMVRYFSMTSLPKSEQESAIRFEARKYIPFKIEEIVSDYKILQASQGKKMIDVFFIAATKERLRAHMDTFKKAGTTAISVDVIPFALMRVLLLAKKLSAKENAVILYIDSGREFISIYIVEMGLPFLSRDLQINVDDKEAFFEKVVSELRLSIDYYYRQNPTVEVSKIIVCGEMIFAGLDAFIADELKIITETVEQLPDVKGTDKIPSSSIVAVGTALGGLGRSRYSVNLSPFAAVMKKKKIARILLSESLAVISIIILTFIVGSIQLARVMVGLNAIKEEGKDLKSYSSELPADKLDKLKQKKFKELKSLALLVNNRTSWTGKLDRLARGIPKEVWIDSLTISEEFVKDSDGYPSEIRRNISVNGMAFSLDAGEEEQAIIKYFKFLKEDPVFTRSFNNVELRSIEKKNIRGHTVSSFTISAYTGKRLHKRKDSRWRRR